MIDRTAPLQNLGCAQHDSLIWCQLQPLQGGAVAFAQASALQPAAGPDGIIPTGEDDSKARLQSGDVDARGTIPCAQEAGETLGTCTVTITRSTGGDAVVRVRFSNGFRRDLTFAQGRFIRGNPTMSGVGTDTDWILKDGTHIIRVDDQRYLIPDALLLGP